MGSSLLENARYKNGYVVSSAGKVDLLFGFNDTIKLLLYC